MCGDVLATATAMGAIAAAERKQLTVRGQAAAALIVANLGTEVLRLRAAIAEIEEALEDGWTGTSTPRS